MAINKSDLMGLLNQFLQSAGNQGGNPFANMSPQQENAVVTQTAHSPAATGGSGTVKNLIGTGLNILGGIAPGPIGMVAKLAGQVLNDDEWWMNDPGTELTTNLPTMTHVMSEAADNNFMALRPALGEFVSDFGDLIVNDEVQTADIPRVINLSQDRVDTYVVPKIRKVVNAVALQPTEHYRYCLELSIATYSMWQYLKKVRYMAENVRPYYPNMVSEQFCPLMLPEYKAQLDSYIAQLETKLRSSVRIPHTTAQYLAWRFGRIYKSNQSKKSGLIVYNPIPFSYGVIPPSGVSDTARYVSTIVERLCAGFSKYPQALADLFNTFDGHTWQVNIDDNTQFAFDYKEFVLRTNLEIISADRVESSTNPKLVIMDSELTNRTTFMSGTLSTIGRVGSTTSALFPVSECTVFIYALNGTMKVWLDSNQGDNVSAPNHATNNGDSYASWVKVPIKPQLAILASNRAADFSESAIRTYASVVFQAACCKYLDIYNMFLCTCFCLDDNYSFTGETTGYDLTGITIDSGLVAIDIIGTEHNYACANLFSDTKHYQTKGEGKRELAQAAVDMAASLPAVPPKEAPKEDKVTK